MAENTDPKPLEDNEEIEVVAHSEEEEAEAGCIVNNSSDLN
ncbi:hypothetical protein [Streptomyces sp. NPDC047000]